MSTKSDLENYKCNETKLQLIKKIIDKDCDELTFQDKNIYLNLEKLTEPNLLNNKVLLSGDIFNAFSIKLFKDPSTQELPRGIAVDFINEFERNFKEYLKPLRIHAKHIQKWFNHATDKMDVYISENGGRLIFYVKDNDIFYQVSDTVNATNIITDDIQDFSRQYEETLGRQLDEYIKIKKWDDTCRNTRKFEIGKMIFDELDKLSDTSNTCVLCIPSIIMDDTDPDYKYRLTFILAIADYRINYSVYSILIDYLLYDRNGLCPPGTC